ncbi:DUF1559 domain-containing protein [Tautonia sp. JC769]|uniref:DUF1559 family PulG-like putative transporter n=1 Tax=Tautonia sp. JC769 TaxID=3232135 RepID=UPI003458FBC6
MRGRNGGASPVRPAFTLIELLAVILVIGLLTAIVVPAVQGSREAARRLQCMNHLKQIGLALNHYGSLHGYYPGYLTPTYRRAHGVVSAHAYSPLARLLAQLDQVPLYDAANFEHETRLPVAEWANRTVMTTTVEVFLCPSDAQPRVPGFGRVNYRFNVGPTPLSAGGPPFPFSQSGPFTAHRFRRPAEFRDGLSNTIGVSERVQGDWTRDVFDPSGDYHLRTGFREVTDPDGAARLCASLGRGIVPAESRSGESWFLSGYHCTNYNHCQAPNASDPDCAFGGESYRSTLLWDRVRRWGVFTARSRHRGGVNALSMDGSVSFVSNGIALPVWRAKATCSGGEVGEQP